MQDLFPPSADIQPAASLSSPKEIVIYLPFTCVSNKCPRHQATTTWIPASLNFISFIQHLREQKFCYNYDVCTVVCVEYIRYQDFLFLKYTSSLFYMMFFCCNAGKTLICCMYFYLLYDIFSGLNFFNFSV